MADENANAKTDKKSESETYRQQPSNQWLTVFNNVGLIGDLKRQKLEVASDCHDQRYDGKVRASGRVVGWCGSEKRDAESGSRGEFVWHRKRLAVEFGTTNT